MIGSAVRGAAAAELHLAQRRHTVGGGLASAYLATWVITRLAGHDAAEGALHYVAPVGEKQDYIDRARRNIFPYLPAAPLCSALV